MKIEVPMMVELSIDKGNETFYLGMFSTDKDTISVMYEDMNAGENVGRFTKSITFKQLFKYLA